MNGLGLWGVCGDGGEWRWFVVRGECDAGVSGDGGEEMNSKDV